jgi:hypothetical protein
MNPEDATRLSDESRDDESWDADLDALTGYFSS